MSLDFVEWISDLFYDRLIQLRLIHNEETILSVRNQDYPNIEPIIVDGQSRGKNHESHTL